MIKYARLLGMIIFVGLFLSSCREPKSLEFRDFKNLSLDKIGFDASTLKVDLIYYNPNNFGLELSRTDFDLYIDSTYLGHSNQNVQVAIPKRGEFTLPLVVDLDMKNLLKNGMMGLFNRELSIRIVGKVRLGKAGVYKSFPVDYRTIQQFSLFQ